jgi:hypothetical protein
MSAQREPERASGTFALQSSPLRSAGALQIGRALLLFGYFLLFSYADMSDLRKDDTMAGQSMAPVLFRKMQADRF